MSREIHKEATVVEITEEKIVLEICAHEACGSCAAKGMCGQDGQSQQKRIELHNDGVPRNVGDKVTLVISSSMGLKGAFFAYFLPVVVVLSGIIVMQQYGIGDFVSGIVALAILALYFLLLWIFKDKIEKNILVSIL